MLQEEDIVAEDGAHESVSLSIHSTMVHTSSSPPERKYSPKSLLLWRRDEPKKKPSLVRGDPKEGSDRQNPSHAKDRHSGIH